MTEQERLARDLYERLRGLSSAKVMLEGSGVRCAVDVSTDTRRAFVHCYWNGAEAALMLGMNPANARASHGVRRKPRRGAEYLVELFEGVQRFASSRWPDVQDVTGVVEAWAAARPITEIVTAWPFVNASLRELERVRAAVGASCGDSVRMYIDPDMTNLSIQGDERSCRVLPDDEGDGCSFFLKGVQVAWGDITRDPGTAITRWMRGATLAELAALGIAIERHAELWEREEYLRWHWMHVRDRIADPTDVLAPLRPLLEKLAESSIATQFYSFSSLSRFCFSACSQYPWVTEGLPMIAGLDDMGHYVIIVGEEAASYSLHEAVAKIEQVLGAYPIKPFRGSRKDRNETANE